MVEMKTSLGTIKIKLFEHEAPNTVANFLAYVKEGFYDGSIFHRVIANFMIQGGGFESGMSKLSGLKSPIKNEANNGLKNEKGTIAMARTADPHSATCQFFINCNDNSNLDHERETEAGWGYCVFGKVEEGMDVVENISRVKTSFSGFHRDVPVEDIVIESIKVV